MLKINKPLPTPEEAIERINKAAAADPKLGKPLVKIAFKFCFSFSDVTGKRLGCAFAFCILMNRVKSTICDPTKVHKSSSLLVIDYPNPFFRK